jgi:hypothetical protein
MTRMRPAMDLVGIKTQGSWVKDHSSTLKPLTAFARAASPPPVKQLEGVKLIRL